MGKSFRRKRLQKKDFKNPRPNEWDQDRQNPEVQRGAYQEIVMDNPKFVAYYKLNKIVPEDQWDAFMESLRTPLPVSFRINGSGKFAAKLRDRLEQDFFAKLWDGPEEVEGEKLDAPKAIPWYPNKLAWQFTYSRSQLRKNKALADIHELLKRENTAGGISRQEAVSMVPPLFLDVQPQHRVLDSCAAPGSKTAQLLELLHEGTNLPSGVVFANDMEPQRCNLLVHRTRHMNSPALIVTNHDASTYPIVGLGDAIKEEEMRFDRILCDVPCSGDGTLRKAADIWKRWNSGMGPGLHPLQLRIALRNAVLLKVGGRMVYSTCSFNPIENEAVVAELLRQSHGALHLVDVSHMLPKLQRMNGLSTWYVKGFDQESGQFESCDAANAYSPSMLPEPGNKDLHLERCMRILPHMMDTGGFFIAVLEKTKELPPTQPDRWRKVKISPAEWHKKQRSKDGARLPAAGSGVSPSDALPADSLHNENIAAPSRVALSNQKDPESSEIGGTAQPESGKNTAELSDDEPDKGEENGVHDSQRAFGAAMENRADEAAQAAVTFADAVADENVKEAADAAEDAAEAVEDVAEEAKSRKPPAEAGACEGSGETPHHEALKAEAPKDAEESKKQGSPAYPPAQPFEGARTFQPRGPNQRRMHAGIEPLEFYEDDAVIDAVSDFFGIHESFPMRGHLVVRIGTSNQLGARKLYYVSQGVRDVLQRDPNHALKIMSAGLKVLAKVDKRDPVVKACPFRISQDGLGLLLPHVTKQILKPTAAEMLRILKERWVYLPSSQRIIYEEDEKQGTEEPSDRRRAHESAVGESEGTQPHAKRARADDSAKAGMQGAEDGLQEDQQMVLEHAERDQPDLSVQMEEGPAPDVKDEIEPKGEAKKIPISDLETLHQLKDIQGGCIVCVLRETEAEQLGLQARPHASGEIGPEPMAFTAWRGRTNISVLVEKHEAASMAIKLEAAIQAYSARNAPQEAS